MHSVSDPRRGYRSFTLLNFVSLVGVDLRQKVLNYVVLPVVDGAVPFYLVSFELNVLNVHTGIVREVSKCHLYEFLGKEIVLLRNVRVIKQVLHRLLASHSCARHVR